MKVEHSEYSCSVSGHPVGVESFTPARRQGCLPLVVLLHGRDGPDAIAGDRGYRDLARAVAAGGCRVLLPRYFERTRGCEPEGGSNTVDRTGWEVEQYGLWLEVIAHVIRGAREASQPVGLLGYSLGGYLALTAAMTGCSISAVAVCYAGVPSPFAGLAAKLPPTLVLHGGADTVVPVREAVELTKLLRRHRIPHELHIYPAAGHGFCGADAVNAVAGVAAFFRKHLGNKA